MESLDDFEGSFSVLRMSRALDEAGDRAWLIAGEAGDASLPKINGLVTWYLKPAALISAQHAALLRC